MALGGGINKKTVSFPNSDFSEWNKKTPEEFPQEFMNGVLRMSLLRSSVALAYFLPVDQVPERCDVVWTSILVM